MQTVGHLAALRREGELLAAAAADAGPDAAVPTCPGWRVRDLLGHVGGVHRWAAEVVHSRVAEPLDGEEFFAAPPDDALLGWFRDGHAALVDVLAAADPDVACWAFLPAPSPLAFWARRQAHETAVHRVDAEAAAGRRGPVDAALAVDGVDELLLGFFSRRRSRLVADPPVTLGVRATDVDASWTVAIGPQRREVTRERGPADCVLSGPASDLYLWLWNRRDLAGLDVAGDPAVLDLWRERARVTWS